MPACRTPPLLFVNIELTLRCNLRCLHCGSTAGNPRPDEFGPDQWITVMEELAAMGCREVCLLGGEPLLASGWFDIANAVCGLGMDLVLISNGWLIDRLMIRKLRSLKRLDRIGISLDGASASVHDHIRGRRDSFHRAVHALRMLRDAGFETGAITSVSRLNLQDLVRIRDLLVGQNLTWQLQVVAAHGRRWSDEWNLAPEQFYQVAEFISKSRAAYGVDDLPVAGSHCFGYFSERLSGYTELPVWPGCGAGIATLGICSSGQVKPCLSLPDSRIIGDLKMESLNKIWEDDQRFRRTRLFSPVMLEGFCRECPHSFQCRGGCPNLPLALTGSDADNPFCCYRLEQQGRVPPYSLS